MKYITALAIWIITGGTFASSKMPVEQVNAHRQEPEYAALKVLQIKCNVCHRRQNPFRVFTAENMNKNAPNIYEQVFVKKSMPKVGALPLTAAEQAALKKWLEAEITKTPQKI